MYSRFKALNEIEKKHQEQLQQSTVLIVGLGATGSAIAENLARHGIKLKIIDRDYLEKNDTYSSSLYTPEDCKKSLPKAKAAEKHLQKHTEVESFTGEFANKDHLLENTDLIMDGTDNLQTRYKIDKVSKQRKIDWIYTAAIAEKGYSLYIDQDTCFKCFANQKAKGVGSCEIQGIMREVSQIVAAESSKKAVKNLIGKEISQKLYMYPQGRKLEIKQSSDCVCEYSDDEFREALSVCGENKYQIRNKELDFDMDSLEEVIDVELSNDYLVRGSFNGYEAVFFDDGRAIIKAEDKGHAKSIYNKVMND